ncbi:(2Fe-2S)-binding protein [Allosphingosinicella vermicomposti]|uniref:(2Fe-2S)-binding protein n=1 Tax=Allosphingosinicella vermicomposti TaxID=614671 RepID=UPI000D10F815|nr:(2Fe-2S)-binding protein [Allosphingosinicella vermicomposti]
MTRFTVNGQPVHYRMDPDTPLLWALRDASNLTGTKYGCGTGECGACTVLVDGQAMPSCRISIAQAEGSFVTTIEGLSRDRSHPVQQAFAAQWAVQCGYCTPGFIMAVTALVDANPNPSDAEIDAAITNLCPCGTYPRVRQAVRRAAQIRAGREESDAAPPPGVAPGEAARTVPALRVPPQDSSR